MAGTPEVKVRIAADNKDLDAGLAGAGRSLGDFGAKIPLIGAAVAAAGAAVAAFAKGAVDEAAKAEVGMVRLGTAVSNAGGDFRKLSPDIEATVGKVMKLSTATDDDLRGALTNMIAISGDVSGSMKNLSLVTDVAAYSGKSLEESAKLVGKAMTGNTKALSEFGNEVKLAEDPMEALRLTVSGFAEREANTFTGSLQQINNQWGEFQEAVGKAILGGGEASAMADGLAGVLANLVGWVEKNESSFVLVKDAVFGAVGALFDVGKAIYDVVQPALGPVMKGLFVALMVSLNTATLGVRTLTGFFKGLAGSTLESLGTIVEKGGKLLRIFGVDVVAETGASIKEYGRNLSTSAKDQVADAQATYAQGMGRLFGDRRDATRDIETFEAGHQRRVTGIHEDGHEKRLTKAQEKAELMKLYMERANEIFAATTKALEESTRPTLRDMKADWSAIDEKVKQAATSIRLSKDETKFLAEAKDLVRERQEKILKDAEATKQKFHEQVDKARSLGESFLGLAQSAGALDDKAASTLRSVIQMGTDLAKFGFASPQGVLAVVSGLAQLIGGWGSSPAEQARKEAHLKNTRALEELSKDFGDYTGSASGRTFQGVTDTLGGLFKDAPNGRFVGQAELSSALRASGLTYGDAKKLAEKYGIDVDTDQMGWFRLFQVLKTRQFGAAGNFTDQLASLEDSFGVLGVEDADDKLKQFGEFLDQNVPALKGALGNTSTKGGRDAAVARLKALYTASITGKLAPAEYGKASPSQFRQIVSTLLQMLGTADGFLSTAQTVTPTPGPTPTDSGPLPDGSTKDNRPKTGTGLTTNGMAAPTFAGGSMAFDGLSLGGGATIGTMNNNVTLNVQSHPDESAAEYAERVATIVADRLGTRYLRQQSALGIV